MGVKDGTAHGLLALCYINSEDGATAEFHYRKAISRQPETKDWWIGLAKSLDMQGRYDAKEEVLAEIGERFEES